MKRRETVWFWLIAISLMVFAMCVLSLQIIELHQDSDLKRYRAQHIEKLELKVPEAEEKEVTPEPPVVVTPPAPQDLGPKVILSAPLRTPKMIREYDRTLYDVPAGPEAGFWALLRGKYDDDKLIRSEWIAKLKRKATKRALAMEPGPSESEVFRMFGGNAPLDTAMLPYLAQAVGRTVIVSDSQNHGYDLFFDNGDTEHYDFIEDINKYAENHKSIWLHLLEDHWTVAMHNSDDEETFYLLSPQASERPSED